MNILDLAVPILGLFLIVIVSLVNLYMYYLKWWASFDINNKLTKGIINWHKEQIAYLNKHAAHFGYYSPTKKHLDRINQIENQTNKHEKRRKTY